MGTIATTYGRDRRLPQGAAVGVSRDPHFRGGRYRPPRFFWIGTG